MLTELEFPPPEHRGTVGRVALDYSLPGGKVGELNAKVATKALMRSAKKHMKRFSENFVGPSKAVRLESDRRYVLRHVAMAHRKGGNLSIMGVYGGLIDKASHGSDDEHRPSLRTGQIHGRRYQDKLIDLVVNGDVDPFFVATHQTDLEVAQEAFETFRDKTYGCLRVVFKLGVPPQARSTS